MIDVIHVSSRGQIVIPEHVRENLGIKTGSKLIMLEQGNTILLKKEEHVLQQLQNPNQEIIGWLALAEKTLQDVWDNPEDEAAWKRYL